MSISWELLITELVILGLSMYIVYALVTRRLNVKNRYQFETVFMRPGLNDHKFTRGDELDFQHDHDSKKYEIKSERIYRVKPGLKTRIQFKIVGIRQRFIIVFQDNKTEPLTPVNVKISARILAEVADSQALKKALKNEFSVPMELKRIVIIIGLVILAAVIYLVATGQMVIS